MNETQLKREITLHKHLAKHQNIIYLIASGEDVSWTWIAMELADGGDLFDKIEPDVGVGEDIAHFYFFQLMNAVSYMHTKGIAHRDLKPENILLSATGDLKLADFGLAALFEKDGHTRLCNTVCGSPPYIAPEVVRGRRSKRPDLLDEGYAPNICDIWSCGVVLFVLLVGNTPWDEPTMRSEEFREYVETRGNTTDELWQQLPPAMVDLLLGMLTLEPSARYTIHDIQNHPWFRRSNKYLSPSGRSANPVGLAAEMLSQLRIDFSKPPTQSQRGLSQDSDAMDIDSSPVRSRANPENINVITAMQPITPFTDAPFDWDETPQVTRKDSKSELRTEVKPAEGYEGPTYQTDPTAVPVFSDLPDSTQEAVSQDPVMSQFSSQKRSQEDYITLTQAARQFRDVLPPSTLARFLSPLSISTLIPLVVDALQRLGIPSAPIGDESIWERDGTASVRVKMADGRRQSLSGHVVVERISLNGAWTSEVRFIKASGDPLEWRRFFRNVVVFLGERVVMRPS
jgi:serine/threonine-protein kinase Chk1